MVICSSAQLPAKTAKSFLLNDHFLNELASFYVIHIIGNHGPKILKIPIFYNFQIFSTCTDSQKYLFNHDTCAQVLCMEIIGWLL